MKTIPYAIIFLVVIAGNLSSEDTGDVPHATPSRIRFPSDLLARGSRGTSPFKVDFILHPIRDFRLIYCDDQVLDARVRSGVCIIDTASTRENRKEVKIAVNTRLADVLKAAGDGLEDWRPGLQPSLRIVTERAILGDTGKDEFLETRISPGDFIVLLKFDAR
jgi:hypothetical protein